MPGKRCWTAPERARRWWRGSSFGRASGKTPEQMLRDRELYASEEIDERLSADVARYQAGEPLAYILGEWDFAGMTLTITPDVLIPRDDTMAVTELAMKRALFLDQNPRILDLCAGSRMYWPGHRPSGQ